MTKPITIKDIAAHVGVSNTTVSAVLGPRSSGHVRVSEATRARILAAAEQMHYRPNRVARSLRYQETNVIGIYTAYGYLNPHVAFTSQIIGGLHLGCNEHKKDLLLHGSYRDRPVEEIYAELADGRVEALVLYTSAHDPLVERLVGSTLPVVAVIDALPGLPSVVADDAGGSRLLAAHLARQGHQRIRYIVGRSSLVSAVRRQQAFREAAIAYGMEITECSPSSGHERLSESEVEWLTRPREQRPTAAVCWNDLTAYNLLEHCRHRGLRLPEDLAVVGFDGIPPPNPTPWRLTTIRAPWVDVVRTAVALLVDRLNGNSIPPETVLPVEFALGDTA